MTPARLRTVSRVVVREGGSDRADWSKRGLCLDEDPELFFPIGNTGPALQQIEEAKAVCRRCPVEAVCLERALERREPHGVWGGLDQMERANLLRSHARKTKREAAATFQGSRLDDIVLLLADGVAPENIAQRLHSSLPTLARSARRAGARDIANQFERADRVVNPDAYHLRDRRGTAAKKQKAASA